MADVSFSEFDERAKNNDFWAKPIQEVNRYIEGAQDKDMVGRSGITLVIGCPLPPEIQARILEVQRKFDRALSSRQASARVRWREDLTALHITVYGLVKPDDYQRGVSWPVSDAILNNIRDIISKHPQFELVLQGLDILRGAVAVRISNSSELSQIRDDISKIQGVSQRGFGERFNQMIIGRFLPGLTDNDRHVVRQSLDGLRDFRIGQVDVVSFELVYYKHEFLNRLYDQQAFLKRKLGENESL